MFSFYSVWVFRLSAHGLQRKLCLTNSWAFFKERSVEVFDTGNYFDGPNGVYYFEASDTLVVLEARRFHMMQVGNRAFESFYIYDFSSSVDNNVPARVETNLRPIYIGTP